MKNLPHDSARLHVAGKSEFIDDIPARAGELYVEVVMSKVAHGKIKRIDSKAALALPGVVAVFLASDLKHNRWGTIFQDQPLLAETEVQFVGESIALVAAQSREAALAGRDLVKVEYEELPAILSIEEAKRAAAFLGSRRVIERGEAQKALSESKHLLNGKVILRGADHFYLESQCAVAYPLEGGQVEVHSSSQHSTETQHVVAHALGLPYGDVVCIVKRMGGAFGGKESQAAPYAAYAALVAHKLGRPARVNISKDDDMIATGKRNPFENTYRVGFDSQGMIQALDVELFSDGGAYADLSTSIMERAMLHCDSAYYIPHLRVAGQVCRTNFHPHTAFRGFGGPKGVATMERIIEEIGQALKIDPLDIRQRNCYGVEGERSFTHYGQQVENNCLPKLFSQLEKDCSYRARRKEIERNNQAAVKGEEEELRGLSLTPVKFGISFTTRFLNQANALVILQRDGSVQVSTGATEMGQGVNARIATMVARELGIERDRVRLMPTRTDKNANTSPTAASSGTDLNGAAALIATRKIKYRLSQLAAGLAQIPEERWARKTAGLGTEPEFLVKELEVDPFDANQYADWETGVASFAGVEFSDGVAKVGGKKIPFSALVHEAYHHRISLSEYGFYKFPGLSFNKLTGKGQAFLYFTQGVAASEVSVNRLTGELKVRRVDILMDLGRPVNEGLDIGQITGGFVQGMGWVTTEKLHYSNKGMLLSHSPSTYKIPSVQDIPREFRVSLFANEENRKNVQGTKAVGEPPLLLAISVWAAAYNALASLPEYSSSYPNMELPATQEELLRAISPALFSPWEKA